MSVVEDVVRELLETASMDPQDEEYWTLHDSAVRRLTNRASEHEPWCERRRRDNADPVFDYCICMDGDPRKGERREWTGPVKIPAESRTGTDRRASGGETERERSEGRREGVLNGSATPTTVTTESASGRFLAASRQADWGQVVANGGPPCFHIEGDGRFCFRAERWQGHGSLHAFTTLADALRGSERPQEAEGEAREAVMRAHRVVTGEEHDASVGRLHGCCIICAVPWPCEYHERAALRSGADDLVTKLADTLAIDEDEARTFLALRLADEYRRSGADRGREPPTTLPVDAIPRVTLCEETGE